jgi:hypothetical protein
VRVLKIEFFEGKYSCTSIEGIEDGFYEYYVATTLN